MASVPEKPTLDGIEAALGRALGRRRHLPLRPGTAPGRGVLHRHAAAHRVAARCTSATCSRYTHTDTVARFQRMRGRNVFYPIGWDDNGLPTERRVQNYYGVRCDPSLPYDPDFEPPATPPKDAIPVSRPNFVELCERLTAEDEQAFEDLFRRLGLSVDWRYLYTTIGERSRRVSQRAFLRNLARGEAYQQDAPTLWDVDYRTAVAQAELEDRELPGAYHRCCSTGPTATSSSTPPGPSCSAACVALVAHPPTSATARCSARRCARRCSASRCRSTPTRWPTPRRAPASPWSARSATSPTSRGGASCDLPARPIVGATAASWPPRRTGSPTETAAATTPSWPGKTVKQAQARIVELLRRDGRARRASPGPITHPVKFYEQGDRPLEIVTTPPVVHPQRRPRRGAARRAARARAGSCAGTPTTCATATRTG